MGQSIIPPLTLTNLIGDEPMSKDEQKVHRDKFLKKRSKLIELEAKSKPKEKGKDEKPKS